ncbi:MAG: ParA family protein [Betaproteobacteria bacterium]|jgi:cellulose biosynthesis protein BcsQ|nr:ParA family protein [Betaproteobacteria bacterium]NBY31157.1 ParA family protein [Actinomycetota bacterium]
MKASSADMKKDNIMAFKILVTSQKGGVGKSTLSANLVAYFCQHLGQSTTLIDWDPHGSSSNWLRRAHNVGVDVQHLSLPVDQGGNRPIFEARLQMRRAASACEILLCDLTWSDSIAGELMFEFDMVLVPTSVSEIELVATAGFLNRQRWVFDSTAVRRPMLVVCPTRVLPEQINSDVFSKQRFPVSFMLAPPILEGQTARDLYERGYLMNSDDKCGTSFKEFAQAICDAREIRMNQSAVPKLVPTATAFNKAQISLSMQTGHRNGVLETLPGAAQYSILGRHRQRKIREEIDTNTSRGISIPDFLKRFTRSGTAKLG